MTDQQLERLITLAIAGTIGLIAIIIATIEEIKNKKPKP